jgi:hypothetical protein
MTAMSQHTYGNPVRPAPNPMPARPTEPMTKASKVAATLVGGAVLLVLAAVFGDLLNVTGTSSATDAATSASRPVATVAGARTRPVEKAPPVATSFGDGAHIVGKQIKAGTYTAPGGPDCFWERLGDLTGVIDARLGYSLLSEGPTAVTIKPTDAAISARGCGTFTLVE